MPILYMTIGLPGSGKSTYIEKMNGVIIHSSDNIRQELFGDINDQAHNEEVFRTLHKRIIKDLSKGKNVVYDATNINYKRRMEFLKSLNRIHCEKIALLFMTPIHVCIARNMIRERKVPEDVIMRMYYNFYIPYYYEGWNEIRVISSIEKEERQYINSLMCGATGLIYINQYNPHHSLTIGKHCIKTQNNVRKLMKVNHSGNFLYIGSVLDEAALLHDIGKVKTMTFINSNGEQTDVAHYYQHHLVGAYDSFFIESDVDVLERAILIQWHMQPYNFEKQKTIDKYKKLWGEQLFNSIMLLHEADKMSH